MRSLLTIPLLFAFFSNASKQGLLDANTTNAVASKNGAFHYSDFVSDEVYVAKKIGQSGTVRLIDANTKKFEGISSTEAGELERAHRVDAISIAYGKRANAAGAAADPGAVEYNALMPTSLLNAELQIKQNGKIVFSGLISSLQNAGAANVNERYTEVWPFALGNNSKFEMNVVYPPNVTEDDDFHYLQVKLKSIALAL